MYWYGLVDPVLAMSSRCPAKTCTLLYLTTVYGVAAVTVKTGLKSYGVCPTGGKERNTAHGDRHGYVAQTKPHRLQT